MRAPYLLKFRQNPIEIVKDRANNKTLNETET